MSKTDVSRETYNDMNKPGRRQAEPVFDAAGEREKLTGLLESAGIRADEKRISLLVGYSDLIHRWNNKAGLISKNDAGKIIERHIFESLLLTVCGDFSGKVRVLDMGTGAGLPGIPLKIWNDDIDLVLVESNRKKALFLEHAAEILDLNHTEVLCSRIEDLGKIPGFTSSFDIITGRALAPADQLLEWAEPFLAEKGGGKCLFPKGSRLKNELELIDKNKWSIAMKDLSGHLPKDGSKEKSLYVISALLTNT
ncbi:16S rRNA (guanine(527)-N(7))-methyltransferase RsmG [candidate division KSB1 bacterium]